jgi:hypothetical protein
VVGAYGTLGRKITCAFHVRLILTVNGGLLSLEFLRTIIAILVEVRDTL